MKMPTDVVSANKNPTRIQWRRRHVSGAAIALRSNAGACDL